MKTERLHRVRGAIYGQPWLITEDWLEAICEIFEKHAASADRVDFQAGVTKTVMLYDDSAAPSYKPYEVRDGVAILPLMGPIFPRANLMTQLSGATSIEEFSSNLKTAISDPDVHAAIMHIDSPGGAVSGVFEAASRVFAARSQPKPIYALADGTAASAAYLVGSGTDGFYATEASIVGSIGVILRMDNDHRALLNEGIDPLIIRTGKYKAIGNGPVTEDQRTALQAMVGDYFGRFKDAVTRARAEVDIDRVATGEMWIGQKAVDMKLVDGITTLDALVGELGSKNT